jgi:hypothetical protein
MSISRAKGLEDLSIRVSGIADGIRKLIAEFNTRGCREAADSLWWSLTDDTGFYPRPWSAALPEPVRLAFEDLYKLLGRRLEEFGRAPTRSLAELKRILSTLSPKKSPNDPRDKFVYDSLRKSKSTRWIMGEIAKRKKWGLLTRPQGVYQAAERYAERHFLLFPLSTLNPVE